ncbi:MFS transporter [Glycomyces terrestris]|uniref:MFS transporter n=1 Tax=Glycomyces terrestris TaxID=2493553 RepID=A0A426V2S1_9ACTN|nr:MFS transporter [Glycomyces terrestris]RRS01209.1 MFS transporter [Glycomyces terrestris]
MTTTTPTVPKAGPREWLGLLVLLLPTLVLAIDVTVLNLAVPHLSADLEPTGAELLWIVDVYGFMIAGFLLTMGSLGDRIGRRRLLMIGAAGFGAASVLAAFATTPAALIAARALLGVTGATLMPSTLALLTNMFKDRRQRATALGAWATCLSLGAAVGPILGGALLEWFRWGTVFLLAVPVMALLLAAAPFLLPEYRDAGAGRIDFVSILLSLAAILPAVYGVKRIAEHGADGVAGAAVALGLVVGALFAIRQRRSADPLLDLRLFADRAFSAAILVLLLGLGLMGGLYLFITQYLQSVAGLSSLRAGLLLLPAAAALIGTAMLTPVLTRRIRPAYVIGGALLLSVPGYVMIAAVDGTGGAALVAAGFTLVYAGISPMMVLGTDLVVGAAPPERAGSAAAMSESGMELGIALGVAALGSAVTAVYRGDLAGALPADAPEAVRDAALDTLAGAESAAGALPDPMRLEVLASAREAFTNGLSLAAGIAGAVVAALALAVVVFLRHVPAGSAEEPSPSEADRA